MYLIWGFSKNQVKLLVNQNIKSIKKVFAYIRVSQNGPSGPLGGHDRYSVGHKQQRGKRGAMSSKLATGGP